MAILPLSSAEVSQVTSEVLPSPNKDACLSLKTPDTPSTSNPVGGVRKRLRTPVFLPRANRQYRIICRTQHFLCTSPSGTAARAGDVNIRPWQAFLARGALGDIQKIGHCYSTRFLFFTSIFIPSPPPLSFPHPYPFLFKLVKNSRAGGGDNKSTLTPYV